MNALLTFEGARAASCTASGSHSPRPLRFVWHHVQPREAGGPTTAANLVQVCDSCHYTIHRLMWIMALMGQGKPVTPEQSEELARPPRREQYVLADRGYNACVAAGTIAKIPNEG